MKGSRSIGNGGSTSRYVWTQTLEEVTVHVPIPDGLRAKDLVVLDPADEGGGGGDQRRYWRRRRQPVTGLRSVEYLVIVE